MLGELRIGAYEFVLQLRPYYKEYNNDNEDDECNDNGRNAAVRLQLVDLHLVDNELTLAQGLLVVVDALHVVQLAGIIGIVERVVEYRGQVEVVVGLLIVVYLLVELGKR